MKAAVYYGPRDVRFEEVPTPVLGDGEALLKVKASGICGSDLHLYRHGMFEDLGQPLASGGRILGHEYCGEIVEAKGDVPNLRVGDRVCAVSAGGNAEYCRVPTIYAPIFPIPDEVSDEEAATAEPLATSFHAVKLAAPADGETIVVMGAGIIGLGALSLLKVIAKVTVIVVDISEKRLALARQMGADTTINASQDDAVASILRMDASANGLWLMPGLSSGSVDTVIDCAGVPRNFTGTTVLEQALSIVKENGKVVVVAVFERAVEVDVNVIMRKGIRLLGSWAWLPDEFRQGLQLMRAGKIDRKPLISHIFPLEQASEAFETQLNADESVKVLLKPW